MDPWQPVLDCLTRLKASWPGQPWSWDARFSTIASSFTRDLEPAVRASAMNAFPRGWTKKSIDTAPPEFQAIAERTGLRSGQRLLAGDPVTAAGLYGLWWPWSGGETITLRIGIADAADPLPRIRELFGV
jgi:hypothetical protein